jgi:two-component system phosphate regulon response regulator PhoB
MSGLILVVDDEPDLVTALRFSLHREQYETRVAHSGVDALLEATREPIPDLIVLDRMLPDLPGTEVCRRLKADPRTSAVPVVMLTARGTEADRVQGFENGADDYVVKPFNTRELLLRIAAVLRRGRPSDEPAPAPPSGDLIQFGLLKVDPAAHRVWVADEERILTALEFRLLTTFLERKGRVQSREALLDTVWGVSAGVTTRTVDTHVKRLRQKLGAAGVYVHTLRGVGYRFQGTPQEAAPR